MSLGLLLLLQACAYRQAMTHGDGAAAAADWDRAYDAYKFANELKPGRAEEEVAQARFAAAGAELAAADAAIAAGDFAKVAEHLERAEDRDPAHIRLEAVRSAARGALAAELARRLQTGEAPRETYQLAMIGKRMDPAAPQFEDATAALRARIAEDSRNYVKQGNYAQARLVARIIGELEPEQATAGAKIDQAVTDSWVAALVDQAEGAEARPGLASVYYARAFEVGNLPEHEEAAEEALKAAAPAAGLQVFVDSKGDGGGHWRLRKALRATVGDSPGVTAGWTSSWDLQAMLYTSGERCKETKAVVPMSKEYVSGTRQVANPAYTEVKASLTQAEAARTKAKAAQTKAQATLEPLREQAKELEFARDMQQRGYDAAVASQAESDRQLKIAQDRQVSLDRMAEGGDPGMVATAKSQQAVVAEWTEKSAAEAKTVAAAKTKLDAANAKYEPVKAALEQQAAATKEAEARYAEADKLATELGIKERGTVPELAEEVKATYKYAETTWTMTCDVTATVYFGTRWKSGLDKKQTFQARVTTTDVSRPGHAKADVSEDLKVYPRSQADLVLELDQTETKAIAAAIEARVDESFDRRIEAALASSSTNQATDTLLAVYAGAPERLDNAARTRLMEHLKANYGLENPGVLGLALLEVAPEPTAPPQVAAEAEPAKVDVKVEEVALDKMAN